MLKTVVFRKTERLRKIPNINLLQSLSNNECTGHQGKTTETRENATTEK